MARPPAGAEGREGGRRCAAVALDSCTLCRTTPPAKDFLGACARGVPGPRARRNLVPRCSCVRRRLPPAPRRVRGPRRRRGSSSTPRSGFSLLGAARCGAGGGVFPEGERGTSAARLGGREGRNSRLPGCLGRRSSPGTWRFPRSLPPARAPRPLFSPSGNNSSPTAEALSLTADLAGAGLAVGRLGRPCARRGDVPGPVDGRRELVPASALRKNKITGGRPPRPRRGPRRDGSPAGSSPLSGGRGQTARVAPRGQAGLRG